MSSKISFVYYLFKAIYSGFRSLSYKWRSKVSADSRDLSYLISNISVLGNLDEAFYLLMSGCRILPQYLPPKQIFFTSKIAFDLRAVLEIVC